MIGLCPQIPIHDHTDVGSGGTNSLTRLSFVKRSFSSLSLSFLFVVLVTLLSNFLVVVVDPVVNVINVAHNLQQDLSVFLVLLLLFIFVGRARLRVRPLKYFLFLVALFMVWVGAPSVISGLRGTFRVFANVLEINRLHIYSLYLLNRWVVFLRVTTQRYFAVFLWSRGEPNMGSKGNDSWSPGDRWAHLQTADTASPYSFWEGFCLKSTCPSSLALTFTVIFVCFCVSVPQRLATLRMDVMYVWYV